MSNLDVSLTLRMINQLSGPAKAAAGDLKGVAAQAKALDGATGGKLAGDLTRAATAGGKTGAELRNVAAQAKALDGATGGKLAGDLTRAATAGGKTGAELRNVAAQAKALDGASAGRLADGLERTASLADRVTAAMGRAVGATERLRRAGPTSNGSPAAPLTPNAARDRPALRDPSGMAALVTSSVGARAAGVLAPAALVYGTARSFGTFAETERHLTRIGITAEASREEMRAVMTEAQQLSQATGLSFAKVAAGYDALATQGRKIGEIREFMPAVAATAQAAGAEVADIANTAGAVGEQMKIAGSRMQTAFDIMVAGGNAGKFELKDMARYLPSLAPLAASVGLSGEEGLRRVVAVAQVVRNQTGTAEEAASSLNNIFAKMESDETTKRFKKFGIDLRKEMAQARKDGRDLLTVFTELSSRAVKGDISKVPQLFADMELARGMRALLSQPGEVDRMAEGFRQVDGATIKALNRVLDDSQHKIDAMSSSWETFRTRLGEAVAPAATRVLDGLTAAIGRVTAEMERVKSEGAKQTTPPGHGVSVENQGKVNKWMNLLLYGDTAEGEAPGVAFVKSGEHRRVAEAAKAKAQAEIDRERAELDVSERGIFPGLRRDLIAASKRRIAAAEERLRGIDPAVGAVDAAMSAYDDAKARARGYGSARIRQGATGLDPYGEGKAGAPEFGLFPTTSPKRNLSFGLTGAPQITPVHGAQEKVDPPVLPKANLSLRQLDDVLNGRRQRQDSPARVGFDLSGAALARGAATGVPRPAGRAAASAFPSVADTDRPAGPARAAFGLRGPTLRGGAPEAGLPREGGPAGAAAFPLAIDMRNAKITAERVKADMTVDLASAATTAMAGYDAALGTAGQKAVATAGQIAAQITAALNVTLTPTIAPRVQMPATAAPGPATSGAVTRSAGSGGSRGISIASVHVHGVTDIDGFHREVTRTADRTARDLRDDALHDVGSYA